MISVSIKEFFKCANENITSRKKRLSAKATGSNAHDVKVGFAGVLV